MTVSRALHSPEVVAESTRTQVQKAVNALGYIPDLAAGSLSSKKSTMVAVMMPSLHFAGHARTVDGLSGELRKNGYHLLIADSFYSREEEMELLNVILGRRPAGIVMINSMHSLEGRKTVVNSNIPVVETWDLPDKPLDSVVGFSHADVGKAIAHHLIESGFTRIAYLGGSADGDLRAQERRHGFCQAMEKHKLNASRLIDIEQDPMDISGGKYGMRKLLDTFPDTDAAVCMTDPVAMGAMMEARRLGLSIPEDIAIAGHGDFDFSEHLVPSLTTVAIDAYKIGQQAALVLLKKMQGHRVPASLKRQDVGFEIRARESSRRIEIDNSRAQLKSNYQ